MKKYSLLLFMLLFAIIAGATKTNVTSSANLPAAVSAAANGDTLLLTTGTYTSGFNIQNGKIITIKSAPGTKVTLDFAIGSGAVTDANCGFVFEGVTIDRNTTGTVQNYFMDGSTFGNISILAFRNDTIRNIGRCLIRGGNTTVTTLEKIEISNSIITDCGVSGWCFLYPKFYIQNVTVKNSTLKNYTNGESFFRPQVTSTSNVLNFTFENNTVYKWSKSNSYAICYSGNMNSTSSNFTFRNNIFTEYNGTSAPNILNTTGGSLIATTNLIVNYGGYSQISAVSSSISDLTLGSLGLSGLGYPDPDNGDFSILSTSPIATSGVNGQPLGDPRWIKTLTVPVSLSTSVYPLCAGTVSPLGGTYNKGESANLTATRAFGYKFKEWQDAIGNVISTSNPMTLTMDADKNIKAVFSQLTTYDLILSKEGEGAKWGNVTLSPAPVNGKYESGTQVAVTMSPNQVTTFMKWEDGTTQASRQILMDDNKTITATFDVKPFIVGWDFATSSPVSNRIADYYFQTDNTGLLNNYNPGEVTTSWGAGNKTFGGVTYSCVRRYTDLSLLQANTPRYLQARFSGVGYKNIQVKSKIGADNTCVNKYQKIQYSTDGVKFVTLDSININAAYNANWVDCNVTLPEMADSLKQSIYIRWIPETTSGFVQDAIPTAGSTEGFYLANVFVYADVNYANDTMPPVLLSTIPAPNSSKASATGTISFSYNERIKMGTGSISFNGKIVTPVFGSKTVSFAYNNLEYGKSYSFTLPAGFVTDLSGNLFGGTTFDFTVMTRPVPAVKLYDAVVAQDGKGDYRTVQAAIDAAPTGRTTPWLIFIKNGSYKEVVVIPASKPFISLIGQDRDKTIIHEKTNVQSEPQPNSPWLANDTVAWKYSIHNPASPVYNKVGTLVQVNGADFYAENITFRNDWGVDSQNGPQALAMMTKGDRIAFNNCSFRSFQDTWMTPSTAGYRNYAKNCFIEGAVDYVYGAGDCYFEACTLYCLRSGSVIVAPNQKKTEKWGYVFESCTVDGNKLANNNTCKLGRPWHDFPSTVFLNTQLKISIAPEGWVDMGGFPVLFAEYNSVDTQGNPVDLVSRKTCYSGADSPGTTICAKAVLNATEAAKYTYSSVTEGADSWNPRMNFEPVAKPLNLTFSNNQLTWTSSNYAICYVVLRDSSVIGFTTLPSFVDQSALSGKTYKYQVRAANEYGSLSPMSDVVTNVNTGVERLDIQKPVITVSDSRLIIKNLKEESNVSLISIDGKLVAIDKVSGDTYCNYLPLLKGVYILKINSQSYKVIF